MSSSARDRFPEAFALERRRMVDEQIAARGVKDPRVLEAMRRVPRHAFLPPESAAAAYEDHPVPIGQGQTISQPYMVAAMTELLALEPADRVLEIGAGSGYQAAILAELAAEVITIERHPQLAQRAQDCFARLGYRNITVVVCDGTLGYSQGAPYDAILVTAGGPRVPAALKTQLALQGRLVCPVGPRDVQHLVTVHRTQDGFHETTGMSCVFVPLVGFDGWA